MDEDAPAPVKVGDVLAEKYRVEDVLGVGGMGVVVAATHVDLGERRAIKFMLPQMRANTQAVERFMREARAAARLKSEHVVKIHDVGRFDTGEPYMVMEYLEGEDLKAKCARQGSMDASEVVQFTLQALEAIAEAHAAGIVHRDLKPANLFVAKDAEGLPTLKVLDFGISKVSDDKGGMDLTATTTAIGSPTYMSPEQMRSTKNVDARTDIWSMGVIMYELLVGQEPFQGESITALCSQVLQTEPQPPTRLNVNVPAGLEAAVLRCLSKDRDQRFRNVADMAAALAPFAGTEAKRSLRRIRHYLGETHTGGAAAEVPGPGATVAAAPAMAATGPVPALTPPAGFPAGQTVAAPPAAAAPGGAAAASPAASPALEPATAAAAGPSPGTTAGAWGSSTGADRAPARSFVALILGVVGIVAVAAVAVVYIAFGRTSTETTAETEPAASVDDTAAAAEVEPGDKMSGLIEPEPSAEASEDGSEPDAGPDDAESAAVAEQPPKPRQPPSTTTAGRTPRTTGARSTDAFGRGRK